MSGVGLAVAYSFFDQTSVALNIFRNIPELYKPAFAQGMTFGWEARRLQNKQYWDQTMQSYSLLTTKPIHAWLGCLDQAKEIIRYDNPDIFYIRWMDATRQLIQKKERVDLRANS
jgi:hypothetical protein